MVHGYRGVHVEMWAQIAAGSKQRLPHGGRGGYIRGEPRERCKQKRRTNIQEDEKQEGWRRAKGGRLKVVAELALSLYLTHTHTHIHTLPCRFWLSRQYNSKMVAGLRVPLSFLSPVSARPPGYYCTPGATPWTLR